MWQKPISTWSISRLNSITRQSQGGRQPNSHEAVASTGSMPSITLIWTWGEKQNQNVRCWMKTVSSRKNLNTSHSTNIGKTQWSEKCPLSLKRKCTGEEVRPTWLVESNSNTRRSSKVPLFLYRLGEEKLGIRASASVNVGLPKEVDNCLCWSLGGLK